MNTKLDKDTKLSIVIPTLNAEPYIFQLITSLNNQTLEPNEILVIDSSSDDNTVEICKQFKNVKIHIIKRDAFNHGGTRHLATKLTKGDFILFLTQDALPTSSEYIKNLITPLIKNKKVAMSSGRQIAKPDARRYIQLIQEYNYPKISKITSFKDIRNSGIKAFFVSDCCSAYRRSAYNECGGFRRLLSTNEDMLIASDFLKKGWLIAYEPTACVFHSHNLSLKQQYLRNKLVGEFIRTHQSELFDQNEISEGKNLVKNVSLQLVKELRPIEFIRFGFDCSARLLGNRNGKRIR